MPRSSRIVVHATPHHVIQRGHNRQVVFATDEDFQRYLDNLWESKNEVGEVYRAIRQLRIRSASALKPAFLSLPIHFLSIPEPYDDDEQHFVLDLVNDPVVTHSEPIKFLLSGEFLDSLRTWVVR